MRGMRVLGVYREKIFSPGKVTEDAAILDTTMVELSRAGYACSVMEGECLEDMTDRPAIVLSMAQSERSLALLEEWEKKGARVVNSVSSIRNTYRKPLIGLLEKARLPIPSSRILPLQQAAGCVSFDASVSYWLKRGDVHAVQQRDVVKVDSKEEMEQALHHFRRQGIEHVLVQAHVCGEVIKFYGVSRGGHFSAFLASSGDDVTSKAGNLASLAQRSAEAVGLEVYGGDSILSLEGEMILIDINDWPSFSRCRGVAARGIAQYVDQTCKGGVHGLSSH
jgi:glutathione synthase/RimK-type ligase-like ATP-grasp enzyme